MLNTIIKQIDWKITGYVLSIILLNKYAENHFILVILLMTMSTKFELCEVLKNNILLLRFVGLWPSTTNYWLKNAYTFYSVTIISLCTFLDCFTMALNICKSAWDLEKLSVFLTILMEKSIAIIKLICFLRNIATVKSLMEQLDSDFFQPKNGRQSILMESSMVVYVRVFRFFFSICTITVTMFLLSPLLLEERRLPFEHSYPYDYTSNPWYHITYLHQSLSTLINSCTNVGIDTFSAGMMAIIGCQCELLEDKLLNFSQKKRERLYHSTSDTYYSCTFYNFIEHHRQILLFAKRVNKVFFNYVFGQMGLCLILFCTGIYRLSIVRVGSVEFFTVLAFIFTTSNQLFLYCWFGNEVNYKSSKLHLAGYFCDWVGSPIYFQKNLIIFLRKTESPIRIYALSFIPLCVVTFTSIMRSSWSFFLLLRQLNE